MNDKETNAFVSAMLGGWQALELTPDLLNTLILVGAFALVFVAYLVRVAVKGPAHYDRIERQGGSNLLGKAPMEMVYWGIHPLARLLVTVGVSANAVSWMSLFFGVLAGACLAVGHFGFGAVFGTISALLDALDGLVARLSHTASDAGEVLDAAIDRYVEFIYLGGLALYYREFPVLLGLVLLAILGAFMVSYSTAKAEALQLQAPRGNMRRTERAVYLILGAALTPVSIPWIEKTYEFGIPIGYPMIFSLVLVGVLANFSAGERLYAIAKNIRTLEKEARERKRSSLKTSAKADPSLADDSCLETRYRPSGRR